MVYVTSKYTSTTLLSIIKISLINIITSQLDYKGGGFKHLKILQKQEQQRRFLEVGGLSLYASHLLVIIT